jgi:hypothetical protein
MDFWTWPSFVSALHSTLAGPLALPLRNVRELADERIAIRRADPHCSKINVQSIFRKAFEQICFFENPRFSWHEVIIGRLSYIFPQLRVELQVLDFEMLSSAMNKQPKSISVSVLKTWTNVWSTTYRLHCRDKFPCVFGCRASHDDLRHYANCSHMWSALGWTNHLAQADGDLLARFALVDFSDSDFNLVAAAFHLYNTARVHFAKSSQPLCGVQLLDAAHAAWRMVSLSRSSSDSLDLLAL